SITNIVTVSPPAGVNDTNPSNNTASDTDTITPHGPSLPGLTAGFWAQHLQVWNTWTGDDSTWSNISSKGSGVIAQAMDINPFPVVDWNQSGGITGATVFSSSGAVTVGNENDSGLLLGD